MGHNSISALMKINSFVQYKKINKTIPQSFKGNKGYSECTHLHGMYNDLVTISKLLTTKDKMYWGRRMAMSIIWLGSILQWFCWLSDWCCAGDEPQSEDVGRGRGGCHVQGGRKCKNDTETGICVVWWVFIRSRVHTYLPLAQCWAWSRRMTHSLKELWSKACTCNLNDTSENSNLQREQRNYILYFKVLHLKLTLVWFVQLKLCACKSIAMFMVIDSVKISSWHDVLRWAADGDFRDIRAVILTFLRGSDYWTRCW